MKYLPALILTLIIVGAASSAAASEEILLWRENLEQRQAREKEKQLRAHQEQMGIRAPEKLEKGSKFVRKAEPNSAAPARLDVPVPSENMGKPKGSSSGNVASNVGESEKKSSKFPRKYIFWGGLALFAFFQMFKKSKRA